MNLFQTLRSWIGLNMPKSMGKVNISEIKTLLQNNLQCSNVYISDVNLDTTTWQEAKKFSEETMVTASKYMLESHDCDNFSFALMGYWSEGLKSFAFGIAWSTKHAFNIMIDYRKNVFIIEPQTNEYLTISQAKSRGLYFPIKFVLM